MIAKAIIICLCLVLETDGVILQTGLAPEIPEDLYMLIKKVRRIALPSILLRGVFALFTG